MPELHKRVEWIINWYQQPALIEKYVPGPEFTVGVLGNGQAARVLGIAKLETPVAGFDEKQDWQPNQFVPLDDTSPLKETLSQIALQTYHTVECKDTGRIDIRLDDRQRPQILEINPLPGLDPTYSFLPLIAKQAGLTFTQLIGEILQNAMERWSLTTAKEHK
jgi:D-alanine-D-alanine ligase